MRGRGKSVIGLAAASLGVALAAAPNVAPQGRIYGHGNIKRHLQKWGRSRQQGNSPAGYSHDHERERSRRLRQECVVELNRANRYLRAQHKPEIDFGDPLPEFGLTRRGRKVALA